MPLIRGESAAGFGAFQMRHEVHGGDEDLFCLLCLFVGLSGLDSEILALLPWLSSSLLRNDI